MTPRKLISMWDSLLRTVSLTDDDPADQPVGVVLTAPRLILIARVEDERSPFPADYRITADIARKVCESYDPKIYRAAVICSANGETPHEGASASASPAGYVSALEFDGLNIWGYVDSIVDPVTNLSRMDWLVQNGHTCVSVNICLSRCILLHLAQLPDGNLPGIFGMPNLLDFGFGLSMTEIEALRASRTQPDVASWERVEIARATDPAAELSRRYSLPASINDPGDPPEQETTMPENPETKAGDTPEPVAAPVGFGDILRVLASATPGERLQLRRALGEDEPEKPPEAPRAEPEMPAAVGTAGMEAKLDKMIDLLGKMAKDCEVEAVVPPPADDPKFAALETEVRAMAEANRSLTAAIEKLSKPADDPALRSDLIELGNLARHLNKSGGDIARMLKAGQDNPSYVATQLGILKAEMTSRTGLMVLEGGKTSRGMTKAQEGRVNV
jgi:hypothetical protein